MRTGLCSHMQAIETLKQAKRPECEECVKIGAQWVASAHVSGVRQDALLRQLSKSSCYKTRALDRASGDCFSGAWRVLAVLLSR